MKGQKEKFIKLCRLRFLKIYNMESKYGFQKEIKAYYKIHEIL